MCKIDNEPHNDYKNYKYIVVGCGLSGSVVAEQIASNKNEKVLILEKRNHIGGNCYDYIDSETGILLNKYGAHIFHTNDSKVWDYINKFCKWKRWDHKVLSLVDNKFVSVPVNIGTINELFNEHITCESEMREWLISKGEIINMDDKDIKNSRDISYSKIGKKLYDKLIRDYTFKQWGKYPDELDKSVLNRIPIYYDHDPRYFKDKYQALPEHGYTHFFKKLLNSPLITVLLDTDYFEFKNKYKLHPDVKIIYTGPIDRYFSSFGYEPLDYRSINFHMERYDMNYYQPCSVVNYPSFDIQYTRSVEYKHFLNQSSLTDDTKCSKTIVVFEKTTDEGEPYYPVPNDKNLRLYEKYKILADSQKDVYFIGRLANYKYFNMDQAIKNALDFYIENQFKF